MTNQALQALIDTYGERLNAIILDNTCRLYIGYPDSAVKSISEIKLETIGGTDFIVWPTPHIKDDLANEGVIADIYYPTDCVQAVLCHRESCGNIMLNPSQIF